MDILTRIQLVFRKVLSNPGLVLVPEARSADIEGWDSLAHIRLIIALEKEFKIKFKVSEVSTLKDVISIQSAITQKLGL